MNFIQALMNQSFIQNIVLILVTAALTGLLVPFIKAKVDNEYAQRQKSFEADLDHQKKLRDYQAKLLDDLGVLTPLDWTQNVSLLVHIGQT